MQSSHGEQAANELQAVRAKIVQLEGEVADVKQKAEADPALKLALLQQLPGLRQELGALRQKEERLAAAEAAAAAVARAGPLNPYDQPGLVEDLVCLATLLRNSYGKLKPGGAKQFMLYSELGNRVLHKGIPRLLRSPVLVRPPYWRLLKLVAAADPTTATVITGNPGIGKSAFAPLLIGYLAHEKLPVLYRCITGSEAKLVLIDFRHDTVQCKMAPWTPEAQAAWQFECPSAWVIWDGHAPTGQHDRSYRLVVLSSPTASTWHELMKGSTSMQVLWLATWDLEELLDCLPLFPDVDAALATERYRLFGGIVRLVLFDLEFTVEKAMAEWTPEALVQLLNLNLVGVRVTVSHHLLHAQVDAQCQFLFYCFASPVIMEQVSLKVEMQLSMDQLTFLRTATNDSRLSVLRGLLFEQDGHQCVRTNATGYMLQLVKREAAGSQGAAIPGSTGTTPSAGRGLAAGSIPAGPEPASSKETAVGQKRQRAEIGDGQEEEEEKEEEEIKAGEEEAEGRLPSHHYQSYSLATPHTSIASSGGSSLQLSGPELAAVPGVACVQLGGVTHTWDTPKLQIRGLDSVYLQPLTTNNASWDAYYKDKDQVLLLQYTVGQQHPVWADPVRRFLARLSDEDRQRVKMVFVIPGDNLPKFQDFKYQGWRGKRGKVLKRLPKELKDVHQFVMALPLHRHRSSNAGAGRLLPPG